jgi:hypothetical protein
MDSAHRNKQQPLAFPATTVILTIPDRYLRWLQRLAVDLCQKEQRDATSAPATVSYLPKPKRRKAIPRPALFDEGSKDADDDDNFYDRIS